METVRGGYSIIKKIGEFEDIASPDLWADVAPVYIEKYKWVQNSYAPRVSVRVFHTAENIYLSYHVPESRIAIRHTTFGSDVWKDSCVEFFLNPFPESSPEYFNMEFNALGVMLIGVGNDGDDTKRHYFKETEVQGFRAVSSVRVPTVGSHGSDYWTLHVKVPKGFFERYYGHAFTDKKAIGNFNKCGDETEFEHYGSWNEVVSPTPNFHLPEYFGELMFHP